MTAISQEVDRGSDNWESERAVCRAGVLLKRIPDGAFGQGTRWRIEWREDSRLDFDFIFPEAVLVLDGYGEINRRCNTGPMHSVIRNEDGGTRGRIKQEKFTYVIVMVYTYDA